MLASELIEYLQEYSYRDGNKTRVDFICVGGKKICRFHNQFWTSRQRQASSLHEISYRACFKPQLPRFFIETLTKPGDLVYDPFSGRGTTVLEAGLLARQVAANDLNPLSTLLSQPRFFVPDPSAVLARLESIPWVAGARPANDLDLSMFYHQRTLAEILALRSYLRRKEAQAKTDNIDRWIRMVATNRLSGHSPGFFSVYTLPPNQAASQRRQVEINRQRDQTPPYREIVPRILRKTKALLKDVTPGQAAVLAKIGAQGVFLSRDAQSTPEITTESVGLTVTSPPFLNVVHYAQDNWLRCWFNDISVKDVADSLSVTPSLQEWRQTMAAVLKELYRVTAPGGWVVFEVGEIRKGKIRLDEEAAPLGIAVGFQCIGVLVNTQEFTKTANIWGVGNNSSGTNTNRVVIFHKAAS